MNLRPTKRFSAIQAAALTMAFFIDVQVNCLAANPSYWKWAQTPPMGWNSYDAWGTSVTEDQVLENARYMKEHLRAHGWKYIVVDARWYDAVSPDDDRAFNRERANAALFADDFGRLVPATNRFPSAVAGHGFRPLADAIHGMGLKFGIHVMRGIPRQSVKSNSPVQGSQFTAADAGNTKSICGWCPDMYGVRTNIAGQAWYDSCASLWASWGVDFVKVDDLSNPYNAGEIAMLRKALDKCGRRIVFSTSPGPTSSTHADDVNHHANMWRISGDFWDRWTDLNRAFGLLGRWQGAGGRGHWPDADMIPLGHIGIRCTIAGKERQTRFSKDEQITLMSLWALAPSPLMLGNNLPDTDPWTLSLLTNDDLLAVNQDSLGAPARRVMDTNNLEIWIKPLRNSDVAIGLFNRSSTATNVVLNWNDAGLAGPSALRDLWTHRVLGVFDQTFTAEVPSHGASLVGATTVSQTTRRKK